MASGLLFEDVRYSVIGEPFLSSDDAVYLESVQQLDGLGATRVPLDEKNRIANVRQLTHIISITIDFPDSELASSSFVHIVKPTWIRFSIAKGKQQNPRQYSPDPRYFLNDVIVSCADIPEGDKEAIQGGVIAMGGLYSDHLTKLVTHLIGLSPDDPKIAAVLQRKLDCKILLPHWFDDCLRVRRRISEEPYLLPNPELLRTNSGPPTPRNNKDISTAISAAPDKLPKAAQIPTVFNDKLIMLSDDLGLSERVKQVIVDVIKTGGGLIVQDIMTSNMYICKYREENDFPAAVRARKEIGNLSWLYHLIIHNRWTNPMLRLLHYPVPKHGIPGFQNYKISLSNYTGNVRQYLENLVKASGASFTKTMVQNNTHLITAHTGSEKCEAAKEWNIQIINHLWLEDSYAQNKIQSLTVPRYTHFPSRTNLGEVVGQTSIDKHAINRFFVGQMDSETDSGSELSSEHSKQSKESTEAGDHIEASAPTSAKSRNNVDVLVTPVVRRRNGDDRESLVSDSVHGSRASKTKAMSKIQDAVSDMALFHKEMKRVGGVVHGRDRQARAGSTGTSPASGHKPVKPSPKRPPSAEDEDEDQDQDQDQGQAKEPGLRMERLNKKPKRQPSTTKIKVIVSVYDRWWNNEKLEQSDKAKLRSLGIRVIDQPVSTGFILCAPKIARTKKFVSAVAYGPAILSTEFLNYCLEHKQIPADLGQFRLRDRVGEKKYSLDLQACVRRAKLNNHKLLKGWQIFCTEKVQGGYATFKDIVEGNGGTCHAFRPKTIMSVAKDKSIGLENAEQELFLISSMSSEEQRCWEPFKAMARKAQMVPRIVKTDWLLALAMAQQLEWNEDWLLPIN